MPYTFAGSPRPPFRTALFRQFPSAGSAQYRTYAYTVDVYYVDSIHPTSRLPPITW